MRWGVTVSLSIVPRLISPKGNINRPIMKHMCHNLIIELTDDDGTPIVGIRLSNADRIAWIYAADYEAITERYGFVFGIFTLQDQGSHLM